ncbi:hypothetical protein TBLA_0D03150 [Henningerozyma blattae CBS 6284]|uniref:Agglutinin-like protein N-terminal domain-containing protein n=1 Tax=Henningerozyma blattae (strain ATCC 34711 / CBS 6284 / DSM 70876 / NBRC 10599 / NRRL Y-10934 / UCD 77-7) TaxID=1071380 RepID=I2H363_HENB6|nr:hypothetical protein TBLA_0D03150 [Tetrapisispora blattae CBS 6284]CCH60815.1 hypothetical protein TBLA_0D03150 [Tetrapisispora blattae CBS 6284]
MALSIQILFFYFCLFALFVAKDITNEVFFSNLIIKPQTPEKIPHQGWAISFDFSIGTPSNILKGDTFFLLFPHVYRIKFDDTDDYLKVLLSNEKEAFSCYPSQQAAYKYENTILTCNALNDLSGLSSVKGTIGFSISFSSGDSVYQYELQNAKYFKSGLMNFQFHNMNADVSFDSTELSDIVYCAGRTTTYGSMESYYLLMQCPHGYISEGSLVLNFDSSGDGYDLDCDSIQIQLGNSFNDWWFPNSNGDFVSPDVVCFGSNLMVHIEKAKPDYMLWLNALQSIKKGSNIISHELSIGYTCVNTILDYTFSTELETIKSFSIYQGINFATITFESIPIAETPTSSIVNTPSYLKTTFTDPSTSSIELQSNLYLASSTLSVPFISLYPENTKASSESSKIKIVDALSQDTRSGTLTIFSTIFSYWTGRKIETYSTQITYLVSLQSITIEEHIFYVGIQPGTITLTKYRGWTGSYTNTYSTFTSLYKENDEL